MNETPATVRMIDGATAPVISNVFVNNACAVCTLQITGTFTAATVLVQGIVNVASNQWVTLAAFNLSDLSLEKDGADKAGIYQVGIEGILRVRMNVTEVSGGDITIAAQFGNATINQFSKAEASNLIPITAYDLAVAGGYAGTLEQFETDMGNSASNATTAANSANDAAYSASEASASATASEAAATNMAPVYSASSTYAVGDYVLYNGGLFRCTTAITTAEAWTSAHWTTVKMGPEVSDLKTQISTTDNLNYSVLDGVTISSNKVSTNSKCASVYIRCEPNREYTVSKNAGGRFAVGDTSAYPANGVDCNDVERDNTASTITYKTSNSAVYLIALVYFSDTDGDTDQAKETMLGSVRIQTLSANDVSARDDISKINAETAGYVANKRLLEDPIKGKLIDCLRNVAFINQSGGSVLRSFVNSVGVDSWIDIKGSYTVRTDIDGDIHSTTDERAISRFIDVTGFDSITSEFKDGISPTVQYAVYCYDADKEYKGAGDPAGAKQGTTLRQFISGTKYIRLMFLSANSEAPISDIADKYTGRLLHITFGGSNPSEQICCLTKTEDLSDVL